jgi:hypothetical protein
MKRLHSPDRPGEDSGDPDRRIPDALEDEGGLETGFEPTPNPDPASDPMTRDPRAQGEATRSPDETVTRRHLEGAEQGPM